MLYALLFAATIPWIWSRGRLTIQTNTLLLAMLAPAIGIVLALVLAMGHIGASFPTRLAELSPFTIVLGPFVVSVFEFVLFAVLAFGPFFLIQKLKLGEKPGLD